jgi:tetratricopeptide (TPR) repeat protein
MNQTNNKCSVCGRTSMTLAAFLNATTIEQDHLCGICQSEPIEKKRDTTSSANKLAKIAQKKIIEQKHATHEGVLNQEPHTIEAYRNIAMEYEKLEQYKNALMYHKKVLEIQKKELNEQHPDVVLSYNNIGAAYQKLGQNKKAAEYHKKASANQGNQCSNMGGMWGRQYNDMISLFRSSGRYEDALERDLYDLARYEETYGESDPSLIKIYQSITTTCYLMRDFQKAKFYIQKAIDIEKNQPSKNFNSTDSIYTLERIEHIIAKEQA